MKLTRKHLYHDSGSTQENVLPLPRELVMDFYVGFGNDNMLNYVILLPANAQVTLARTMGDFGNGGWPSFRFRFF